MSTLVTSSNFLIEFTKLLINRRIKSFPDNKYQSERLDNYRKKTISNILLYLYFVNVRTNASFIVEELQRIVLNVFECLGLPDEHFENYIEEMSRSEGGALFNFQAVIRLKNEYVALYENIRDNDDYFKIGHSGYCYIKERRKKRIVYESVYNRQEISMAKFKEYLKAK